MEFEKHCQCASQIPSYQEERLAAQDSDNGEPFLDSPIPAVCASLDTCNLLKRCILFLEQKCESVCVRACVRACM